MGFSLRQTDQIKLNNDGQTYTATIRQGETLKLPLFQVLSGNENARYEELQANGRSAADIIKDIFKYEIQGGGTTANVSDIGELTGVLIGTATLIITSKRAVAPQQTNLTVTVDVKTDSFFGPDGVLTPAIDSVEKYVSDALKTVGGYIGTGAEWAGRQIFSGSQFIQEKLGIDDSKLSDDEKKKLKEREEDAEKDLFAKLIGLPSADLIPVLTTGLKIYLAYISGQNLYMEAQIISSIRSIADYDRFPAAKKLRIAKILKTEVSTLENIAKTMRKLRVIPDLVEKLIVGDNPDYGSLLSGLLDHFGAPTLEDLSPDLKCVVNELVIQKLAINVARKEKSINETLETVDETKWVPSGIFDGDMSPENVKKVVNAQLDTILLQLISKLRFESISKSIPKSSKNTPMPELRFPLIFPKLDKQLIFWIGTWGYLQNEPNRRDDVRHPWVKINDNTWTPDIDESKTPSFAEVYSDIFIREYTQKEIDAFAAHAAPSREIEVGSGQYDENLNETGVRKVWIPAGILYQIDAIEMTRGKLVENYDSTPTDLFGKPLPKRGSLDIRYPDGSPYDKFTKSLRKTILKDDVTNAFVTDRNAENDIILAFSERYDFLRENNIIIPDPKNPGWLTIDIKILNGMSADVVTTIAERLEEQIDKTDVDAAKEEIAKIIQKVVSIRQINGKYTRQNILDIVSGKRVKIAEIKPKLDIGLSPLSDLIGTGKLYRAKLLDLGFDYGRENGYFTVNGDGKVSYVSVVSKITEDEYTSLLQEIESLVIEEDFIVKELGELGGDTDPIIIQQVQNLERKLSQIQKTLENKRKIRDEYKDKINTEERIKNNNSKLDGLKNKREDILKQIEEVNDAIKKLREAKPSEPYWTPEIISKGIQGNNEKLKELNAELQQLESEILALTEDNKELGYEDPIDVEDSTGLTPCLDKYLKMQFMDIFQEIDYGNLPQPVKSILNGVGEYVGISPSDISKTWELISVGNNLYNIGKLGPDAWDEMSPENKAWFAKKFGIDEEWAGDAIKFGADISLLAQGKSSDNLIGLLDKGFLRFRDTFLEKFAPGASSWRDFERLDPKLQSTIAICLGFKPDDKGSHVVKAQRVVRRAVNFEKSIKDAITIKNSIIAKKEQFDKLGGKGNPEMIESLTNDLELSPSLLGNLYESTSEIIRDPYSDFMDNIPSALGGDPGWRQKMGVPEVNSLAPIPYQGKKVTLDVIENPNVAIPTTLVEKLKKMVEDKAIISNNNQISFNPDGSVDWNDDVQITDKALENGKFPVKFNRIKGNFVCSSINLSTLENAPKIVEGTFNCSGNKLTSLTNSPEDVFIFDCSNNTTLTSLNGISKIIRASSAEKTSAKPESIEVILNVSNCALTNLDDLASITTFGMGGINCSNNKIVEFYSSGITPTITQVTNFDCSGNKLTTLANSPVIIKDSFGMYGSYNASNNKIKQLPDGLFTSMRCKDFDISNNEFVDLSFIPIEVTGTFNVTGNRGKGFNDSDLGKNRFTPNGRETTTNRRCSIKIAKTDTSEYADKMFPSEEETQTKSYQYTSEGQTYTYIWCSGMGRKDQGRCRKDAREKYWYTDNMMFLEPIDASEPSLGYIYIGDDVCPKSK